MNTRLCRYRYDALDLLTGLEPFGQEQLQRFYRHQHLVTELQGRASHTVFQHDQQPLAEQRRDGNEVASRLLATDQQRSILQATTAPVRQAYSPYGHRRVDSGLGSLLGFNGEVLDPITGHYLLGNGHRAFNPALMRFNSPDRLSPFGRGGLNAYAYCLGDPVNFSDPTGQIARLVTSLLSVFNAKIVMSPAIPYKLAKDALQWGAAGQLPLKHTLGAVGSTVAGVTTMVSAVTGVASAVAGIKGDAEAARTLGFIALGLAALTVTARIGSFWAARDPRTIPSLKGFVERHKPVPTTGETPPVSPVSPDTPAVVQPEQSRTSIFFPDNSDMLPKKIQHVRRSTI